MEHCQNHEKHSDGIEDNAIAITGIKSSMAVLKWVIGLGLPVFIAIFTLAASKVDEKMNGITLELKEIKAAVHSIAMDQVKVTAEIEGLKWRVDQLESKRRAR